MISVSNVFKLIRGSNFPQDKNTNKMKMYTYLKHRHTILEQLKETSSQKIFNNHRFFRKTKNDITVEGKPEGLIKDGIVITCQSNNNDLTTITFADFVKAQMMMYTTNRKTCLYTSYFQGNTCTQLTMMQNKTIIEYIFTELQRVLEKKRPKKSYKMLLTKVLPLVEGDKLSYFLEQAGISKEKTFTQQWQISRFFKAKNNIFNMFKDCDYMSIPESFSYEECLETLTREGFGMDIIYYPHISSGDYFFQPFALMKTSVIAKVLGADINMDGYTLVFPTYSLPPDYKARSKRYLVQAAFVEEYLKKHGVSTCGFYTLVDHIGGFKMVEVGKYKEITVPKMPKELSTKAIMKHELFPYVHKDRGYKRKHLEVAEQIQDVSLLTNVGPRKRAKLHEQQIYTLIDLYKAMRVDEVELPLLSQRFLEVNNQTKVPILPITLDANLPRYDDECFVDMEFAYDKSLEYTCIYNIGILRIKNNTKKFDQLTIEKLNEDGEFELLDKFFNMVKGNTVIFHWNHTERTMLKSAIERHEFPEGWKLPECIDFYKIMKDNAIAVRGCYNLKLKSVAKAMKKVGLIQHYHEDIVHGTDLSTRIIHMYETDSYMNEDPFIKRVEEYNKDDIYTMYEIIEAVRNFYERV